MTTTATDIATVPTAPLPVPVPLAELAQKLATFDGMDLVRNTVPAIVVAQAKQYLAELERYHAPPPEALIRIWCRKLRAGTAPIGDEDFSRRFQAIIEDCSDLPGWVWNMETLRQARRSNEFFPTCSKVYDVVSAAAFRRTMGMSQVRMLAAAKPAPELEPTTHISARVVQDLAGRMRGAA